MLLGARRLNKRLVSLEPGRTRQSRPAAEMLKLGTTLVVLDRPGRLLVPLAHGKVKLVARNA